MRKANLVFRKIQSTAILPAWPCRVNH